jgi:hypothetical protein
MTWRKQYLAHHSFCVVWRRVSEATEPEPVEEKEPAPGAITDWLDTRAPGERVAMRQFLIKVMELLSDLHKEKQPPTIYRTHESDDLEEWWASKEPEEPTEPTPEPVDWLTHFDDRQREQIAFSRLYARDFNHGADGHNSMLIIARMAELLDGAE